MRGFREILDGKHDDLPEQAFYMVGTIEMAVEKGRRLAGGGARGEPGGEEQRRAGGAGAGQVVLVLAGPAGGSGVGGRGRDADRSWCRRRDRRPRPPRAADRDAEGR